MLGAQKAQAEHKFRIMILQKLSPHKTNVFEKPEWTFYWRGSGCPQESPGSPGQSNIFTLIIHQTHTKCIESNTGMNSKHHWRICQHINRPPLPCTTDTVQALPPAGGRQVSRQGSLQAIKTKINFQIFWIIRQLQFRSNQSKKRRVSVKRENPPRTMESTNAMMARRAAQRKPHEPRTKSSA